MGGFSFEGQGAGLGLDLFAGPYRVNHRGKAGSRDFLGFNARELGLGGAEWSAGLGGQRLRDKYEVTSRLSEQLKKIQPDGQNC